MDLSDTHFVPGLAALLAVGSLALNAAAPPRRRSAWAIPATFAALFLVFTARAVLLEGPIGFWPEHVRNLWGNQIWLDLLLSISTCWFFAVPEAKRLGMRPWPWLVLIVCTGSVGLLAFAARLVYLRGRTAETAPPALAHPV